MTQRPTLARVVLCSVLLSIGSVIALATPPEGGHTKSPALIRHADSASADLAADSTSIRRQLVTIDSSSFTALRPGSSATLPLFDDISLSVIIDHVDHPSVSDFTWSGRCVGDHRGTFIIVLHDGVFAGNIRLVDGRHLQIRPSSDRSQELREIDDSRFGACGCGREAAPAERRAEIQAEPPHVAPQSPNAMDLPGPMFCTDDGTILDVLVVYTPAARAAAGGTAAIQSLINLAVAEANTSYANSQIVPRLNLVFSAEVNYVESGGYTSHLSRLTNPNDGIMDSVHALRNQYGADMVSLLVNDNSLCGLGAQMSMVSADFAAQAFSVVNWNCAASVFSLAHELGHNMGCAHDRAGATGAPPAFDFSFGYAFTGASANVWRTVMATGGGTRIEYFSNPNISYDGHVTGIPAGQPDSADNARTINQAAFTLANFRHRPMNDCNGNGIPDPQDIASGFSLDANNNTIPDECETPPITDTCAGAILVFAGSHPFTNVGATTDGPDEVGHCSGGGYTHIEGDVWFKYFAQCTGFASASVCGATFDTKIAIYGSCPTAPGQLIACNDNALGCGTSSAVVFPVVSGTSYRIRIGGRQCARGSGTLVLTCGVPAPCPADIAPPGGGNHMVNTDDLLAVITSWGQCPPPTPGSCAADIAPFGGNNMVDVDDLLAVIAAWGPCP